MRVSELIPIIRYPIEGNELLQIHTQLFLTLYLSKELKIYTNKEIESLRSGYTILTVSPGLNFKQLR